jgi:hypothetical protein
MADDPSPTIQLNYPANFPEGKNSALDGAPIAPERCT